MVTASEESRTDAGLNVAEYYIIYVDYETNTIHRMNKDGSYIEELDSDESEGVNIIDEWIYYENWDDNHSIYKMKLDGTHNEPIY